MQVYGDKATTDVIKLERRDNQKSLFEAGSCDKFEKKLPHIGSPVKIRIGHDNQGLFAGWHLEKVLNRSKI